MRDSQILSQLVALLRAGMTMHQAERTADVAALSPRAKSSYDFLRSVLLASGGAPILAMERTRRVLENHEEQLRRVQLAHAAPRSTVKLMLWLPIAALVIGQITGLGSLSVLVRSPIALASVLLGGLLLALGNVWSAKLLLRAKHIEFDEAIFFDALALALDSGLSFASAIKLVSEKANFKISERSEIKLQEINLLSKTSGIAVGKLLTAQADSHRGEMNYKKSLELEKLSVRLMLPLGLSVLPAFALIAVVPLALSFLQNTTGG